MVIEMTEILEEYKKCLDSGYKVMDARTLKPKLKEYFGNKIDF